jgi:hypothetical protein
VAFWLAIALGAPVSLLIEHVVSRHSEVPPHWEHRDTPGWTGKRAGAPGTLFIDAPRAKTYPSEADAKNWPMSDDWARVRHILNRLAERLAASGAHREDLFGHDGSITKLVDALVAKAHVEVDGRFAELEAQLEGIVDAGPTRTQALVKAAERQDEHTTDLQARLESVRREQSVPKRRDLFGRRRRWLDAKYAHLERRRRKSAQVAERHRDKAFQLVAEARYTEAERERLADSAASLKAAQRAQGDAVIAAARIAFVQGEHRRKNLARAKRTPPEIDFETERAIDDALRDILGE